MKMALTVRDLKPEEFSEHRKQAMQEMHGDNWMEVVTKKNEEIKAQKNDMSKKEKVRTYILEILDMFIEDDKAKRRINSQVYQILTARIGPEGRKKRTDGKTDTEESGEEQPAADEPTDTSAESDT
jgi:hypothetical protein